MSVYEKSTDGTQSDSKRQTLPLVDCGANEPRFFLGGAQEAFQLSAVKASSMVLAANVRSSNVCAVEINPTSKALGAM